MGKVVLVVKIIYVFLLYLFELFGLCYGCCQLVIDGYCEIGWCCCELGVDIIVVFDIYWLVNVGYYINCVLYFEGFYISNELLYFIVNMEYGFFGNLELGCIFVEGCNVFGVEILVYDVIIFGLEYGILVLMCYMNQDCYFKVVLVFVLCIVYYLNDSVCLGWVMCKVVEEYYDGMVVFFVSGLLFYCFVQNGQVLDFFDCIWSLFFEVFDYEVVQMWQEGCWVEFCGMFFEYVFKGYGEGFMYDIVMFFGVFGWLVYDGKVEVVMFYFGFFGIGQINVVFLVIVQDGLVIFVVQVGNLVGVSCVSCF